MDSQVLSEKELQNMKSLLLNKVVKIKDKKYQKDNTESSIWKSYSLGTEMGRQIYMSFSDEELLDFLRKLALELNHAPSQGEVFWVMKEYIKTRFHRWPYALEAAGLSKSAGKGGKSMIQTELDCERRKELLAMVREKADELGKIPHPKDMGEICNELKKIYSDWTSVIEAAEIDMEKVNRKVLYRIEDLEPEYEKMLDEIKRRAIELGRSPMHGEVDSDMKHALIERCGSWRNALYQIDLQPVTRITPFKGIYIDYRRGRNRHKHTNSVTNCIYEALNLSDRDKELLEGLKQRYQMTGDIPMKNDIPKEERLELQSSCGSWVNVLHQIGIEPKAYYQKVKKLRQLQQKGNTDVK